MTLDLISFHLFCSLEDRSKVKKEDAAQIQGSSDDELLGWLSGKCFQGVQLSGTVLTRQWGSTIRIQTDFLFPIFSSTQSLFGSDSYKLLL